MSEERDVRPRVLVIDDELGPRESLRILLKNECEVLCATAVDEGVRLLKEQDPDVVILDIRMPGKSGIQGLKEIREIDPVVSVVMLTGFGGLETAQQALRLGATDYLNKPFDTGEMREAVRKYAQRTRVERKRVRMLDDLRDANRRLVGDLAEKEQLASLAQSSAEFAHDLRNPLMVVSGYVELLSKQLQSDKGRGGKDDEVASEYLDVIGQHVRRCCELSHMWQKVGKSKLAEFTPTNVSDVIGDVLMGLRPMAATARVQAECNVACNGCRILGSRPQLLRALHNVVNNAVQAVVPGSGQVALGCRIVGEHVEIRVEDNGSGMPSEVVDRIFQPYFTTKPPGKGTGLGLTITKRIVEEHGGSIQVVSTPNKGTVFTIRLPLMRESQTPSAQAVIA